MFALEKKLYAWELEQAYLYKKVLRVFLGLFLFILYFVLKCLYNFAQFLIARPQLYRQIEPNKFEEVRFVNSHHCGLLKI